jgi:hypothetical protein
LLPPDGGRNSQELHDRTREQKDIKKYIVINVNVMYKGRVITCISICHANQRHTAIAILYAAPHLPMGSFKILAFYGIKCCLMGSCENI